VAVANLVLWVGLAVGVAMLASDSMNLGIETLVRSGEATAVAYLRQTPAVRADVERKAQGAIAAQDVAGPEARGTAAAPAISGEGQAGRAPLPVTTAGMDDGLPAVDEAATRAGVQAGQEPAPSPLVLSDPGFTGLMQAGSAVELAARGQQVEIYYDEATLNQEIADLIAESGDLPYTNVRLSLNHDRVLVTGVITVLGLRVNAELLGVPVIEDCGLEMDVQALSIGGLLTPRFIKNQASTVALQALDWYPSNSPVCLEAIALDDGSLTVYGYRR
jgi:hypothetical protein